MDLSSSGDASVVQDNEALLAAPPVAEDNELLAQLSPAASVDTSLHGSPAPAMQPPSPIAFNRTDENKKKRARVLPFRSGPPRGDK